MGILRDRMIEEMKLRNLSPATQESYDYAVSRLARYHKKSPDQLSKEDIRAFLVHLTMERELSPNSLTGYCSGLRFFYNETLGWDETKLFIPPRNKLLDNFRWQPWRRRPRPVFDQGLRRPNYSRTVRMTTATVIATAVSRFLCHPPRCSPPDLCAGAHRPCCRRYHPYRGRNHCDAGPHRGRGRDRRDHIRNHKRRSQNENRLLSQRSGSIPGRRDHCQLR